MTPAVAALRRQRPRLTMDVALPAAALKRAPPWTPGPRPRLAAQGRVCAGGLVGEPARPLAGLGDRDIDLAAPGFDRVDVLASRRGIVFSRDALVQRVWGGDTHITERSVDTLIKRLRKKIEADPAEPRYIATVWGTGYKFTDA